MIENAAPAVPDRCCPLNRDVLSVGHKLKARVSLESLWCGAPEPSLNLLSQSLRANLAVPVCFEVCSLVLLTPAGSASGLSAGVESSSHQSFTFKVTRAPGATAQRSASVFAGILGLKWGMVVFPAGFGAGSAMLWTHVWQQRFAVRTRSAKPPTAFGTGSDRKKFCFPPFHGPQESRLWKRSLWCARKIHFKQKGKLGFLWKSWCQHQVWAWWYTAVILKCGRMRNECCDELEASLGVAITTSNKAALMFHGTLSAQPYYSCRTFLNTDCVWPDNCKWSIVSFRNKGYWHTTLN